MSWWALLLPSPRHGLPVRLRLQRARPQRIAEVRAAGQVCIVGQVAELDGVVIAPLTDRPCVHWMITIEEVGTGTDSVERATLTGGVPFVLVDDGGRARVVPDRARLDVDTQTRLRSPLPTGMGGGPRPVPLMSGAERALYESMEIALNYPATSNVRFTHRLIEPGMQLMVAGHGEREPDPTGTSAEVGYRESALPSRLVVAATRRSPLLIGRAR